MTTRYLRLPNGLRCHLHHQPDARDAAALVQVEAGSLHEPDRWPGLAHLLEHLLFCGSAGIPDEQRLMPWVQQQGGQVNATTQLGDSAFFFQLPARALEAGMARLMDMLAAPRLSEAAIRQESAVIDAEYRLLQRHAATLSEAALLDMPDTPAPLRRFRVGSHAVFGDNVTELQQALHTFHQQHYVAGNMTLWLQGPQSLTELAQLAQRYGQQLGSGIAPVMALPAPSAGVARRQIRLPGEEAFWLTFVLPGGTDTLRDNVTLCRQFWLDEAPGSLLAQLRAAGLCENLSVQWLWRATRHSWLALKFSARSLSSVQAQGIEAQFRQHLRALTQTTAAQRQHYQQLAQEDFSQLTPLEQLRNRATGFAPGPAAGLADLLVALQHSQPLTLLTQSQLAATSRQTQGFSLALADWPAPARHPVSARPCWFYPLAQPSVLRALPHRAFPLLSVVPVQPQQTLLLRPAFYQPLSDEVAGARQQVLRPILAALRHMGGRGSWQQMQGIWQLVLHLPTAPDAALAALQQLVARLVTPAESQPVSAADGIAIRQLLAALPHQLLAPATAPGWQAAWCGSDRVLAAAVARVLSDLPAAAAAGPPLLTSGVTAIPCTGSDQALLLFIPLVAADAASLAALRLLALIYEPCFFQRLRIDQQIGYVVTARYQRVADVDGILLALQSPDIPWRVLLGHCKRFLRTLDVADADLVMLRQTLQNSLTCVDNASAALQALRQQQGLAELSSAAIDDVSLAQLQQLHQHLLRNRRRWRVLVALSQSLNCPQK
ncbi:pyrroloquinoline quinone biosynthesis protein PqqF [Pantoea sp. At-9b]|uniref:pyrroloquinoline quinone biosynthesis protein PqqF n=1 Tax=Pantoea sp. (strain At-9b) TaxID=592316 RepID=UPI0001B3EB0D|nr:pyrroloquinoline quinone biosynthesis protein PqqF [Pantoea sp. At-9b]ADU69108.1 coenzyme PQQ biosynthesis protein PqqF [Pantoea sp. At-9b]